VRKILLTGATGRIGGSFRHYADSKYRLRLTSRNPASLGDVGEHEAYELHVADPDSCMRACEGIDTVVHMAADASTQADFYGSLLDNNIKGAYNIFRAAKDQGCKRVVYASSIQAVAGYPLDAQPRHDMPVRPLNLYGVTKCFGEALCHYFAYTEGLSSVAVRIASYELNTNSQEADGRRLSAFISERDMNHLLERCIEEPELLFGIVQAVSDNRFKRLDISSARELVGYEPQDDAFQIFDSGVQYRQRWYDEQDSRQ
jgi:nucleoside-diphosphate-sugar epimerase